MIVVADTSPLNYLCLIDEIYLLPALFTRVLIPAKVAAELDRDRTPAKVREWVRSAPDWLEVHPVLHNPSLQANVDDGEAQAIQLALERGVHEVLMDDAGGRR